MGLLRDRLNKEREQVAEQFNKEATAPSTRRYAGSGYLDLTKLGIEIPQYTMKDEKQKMDILMYEAGQQHPTKKPSELAWSLIISIHKNIGPMKEAVICPYQTYGEPCPICEYIKANRLPKETWKLYKESERLLQLIWPHTTPEVERRGVHLWDTPTFKFWDEIREQAIMPEDGGTIQYADPEYGQTLYFTRKEEGSYVKPDGTTGKGIVNQGFRFAPRKSPVPDSIADKAMQIHLDDALVVMGYDEIEELFKQTTLLFKADASTSQAASSEAPSGQEKPTYTPQTGKCPADGTFGKDTNKLPECGDCAIYDDCAAEKQSAKAPEAPAEAPKAPEAPAEAPKAPEAPAEQPRKRLIRKSAVVEDDIAF
jgi:hypothetical protein